MHSRLIRLIAVFSILICLPLQGLAAVVMPACQAHGQKMEMHVDTDHAVAMAHCDHHHDGDHSSSKAPCDKCFSCYLGAAQAIIPFSFSVGLVGGIPMVASLIAEIPDSVPSSLYHPPRTTFA